jgi:anti-sigma-K factor RskA
MNEFEWLRQMRELNRPVAPRNDLWARIDAALDETTPADTTVVTPIRPIHRHPRGWAAAASIAALVVLACGISWRVQMTPQTAPSVAQNVPNQSTPWKPSDPRLAGAAVELDAARMELQQAIQQAPDSPALQRLLQRTDAQQNMLRELEKHAG